jgi:hypothetical protein
MAGASGVAFSGALTGGLRVASVAAPKINLMAESVLARSTRLFESTTLGKQATSVVKYDTTRLGSLLDVKEAQVAAKVTKGLVNPVKYSGAVNRIASGVVSVKARAVTVGQRSADIVMPKGTGETASFMRGVARPNLAGYSKVAKTSTAYRKTQIGLSIAKAELRLATKPVTSSAIKLTQNIKGSKAYTEYLYNKAVRTPNVVARAPDSQIGTAVYDNLLRLSAARTVKTVQKVKLPSVNIKPSVSMRAAGKVAAGKIRYDLKLKTPTDVLLKSERTPLKFDAPKVETKQATVQIQKSVLGQVSKQKTSSITGGFLGAYPGTVLRMREEEETTYLTMPKGLTIIKPQLKVSTASAVKGASIVTPSFKSLSSQRVSNDLSLGVGSIPSLGLSPIVTQTPKTTIKQSQQTMTVPKVAFSPKVSSKMFGATPFFGTGGGDFWGGGEATLRGKWRKVNNPVKTADAMLGTFGFKPSKGAKKALRKIERFDKQVADFGFKKAASRKKRGRRKR